MTLRRALAEAGYTVDGVAGRLGEAALAALHRADTVPARRATRSGDALDTLIRLFLLQLPASERAATAALPLDEALELGLVERSAGEVCAALDVRPYAEPDGPDWWLVSDLGTGLDGVHRPLPAEHVLGVGGASTTLAQWTIREPVGRTLDLGTGCGVQALHASRHSDHVVATDVSERALRCARLTAMLSGVEIELRVGDLLEPVMGERFDLIVTNPPFVIGAPQTTSHTYRDAGRVLDSVGADLCATAPGLLNPGGTFQLLANWVHRPGQSWQERVRSWFPDHGVDVLVVQREVLDPAEYVATWLRDSGELGSPHYLATYDAWLDGLERHGVEGIGFGLVAVRRTDALSRVTLLDHPHVVEQPLGPHVAQWFDRQRFLAEIPDLASARLALADDVVQEQLGRPGEENPEHVVLRQQRGLRQAFRLDTATAAVVGACDGQLPLGVLIEAVRTLLEPDQDVDTATVTTRVVDLIEAGIVHPVG